MFLSDVHGGTVLPRILLLVSAAIVGLLGAAHLVLTFFGPKLTPRDAATRAAMERSSPVITRETTMWRTWIGFNASHSLGALLFALVFGYFALAQSALFFDSLFLQVLGVATLVSYLALAAKYWFRTPRIGIMVATASYVAALISRHLVA